MYKKLAIQKLKLLF